jgi:alkanesulfonate monooxygenase SsuD/methylene tetrahydromethanopterin reductase-like flavin-dependent oxidoreductase (luciferase family)
MRIGLHALGIGHGARRDVIDAVAAAAEAGGFAALWAGEHIVMVDEPASRYPYAADGRIAVPADADWLDPLVALSFAAAATRRIGLATGILLVPEHNPLHLAKQAASLDALSGGRLTGGLPASGRHPRPCARLDLRALARRARPPPRRHRPRHTTAARVAG